VHRYADTREAATPFDQADEVRGDPDAFQRLRQYELAPVQPVDVPLRALPEVIRSPELGIHEYRGQVLRRLPARPDEFAIETEVDRDLRDSVRADRWLEAEPPSAR
jgi:hypothetical protein